MLSCLAEMLLDPTGFVDDVRDRRRERRIRQRARTTKIPCAVRVVEGTHPGLRRRWLRGAARVPAGTVVFEPDNRWGRRVTIPVRSASLQPPGRIPRRVRRVGPQPHRIVLRTGRATLEWWVPAEQVERALRVTLPRVREVAPPTG